MLAGRELQLFAPHCIPAHKSEMGLITTAEPPCWFLSCCLLWGNPGFNMGTACFPLVGYTAASHLPAGVSFTWNEVLYPPTLVLLCHQHIFSFSDLLRRAMCPMSP